MKSPLSSLRAGFKLMHSSSSSNSNKDKRELLHVDDLAQVSLDIQDMKDRYDSLLSAAAATANSAFEFSESLRELGSCLMEQTALHHDDDDDDDDESGKVLLMLGKVQCELQKLVDSYRSHIFLTITNPSECLLNGLRNVEDMKRQCDEKRNVYEYMVAQQKEKGRSKGGKSDQFTLQQLQTAYDEYEEEATLCVFRLKSLKQGHSRSLLTQAARHHAAQLNFFRKGLKSLEAVDPQIRLVAEHQRIDYHFSGLEEDGKDYGEFVNNNSENPNDGKEPSFDYRSSDQDLWVASTRNSMAVDEDDISFPQATTAPSTEINHDKNSEGLYVSSGERRASSHSAPIFLERKCDLTEKAKHMQHQSIKKSSAYVLPLPMPADAKGVITSRTSTSVSHARSTDASGRIHNLWHSSPLEQNKHDNDSGDAHIRESTGLKEHLAHKESNSNNTSTPLPLPPMEVISLPNLDANNASDNRQMKLQSYSGSIISKPSSAKPALSASGPISTGELPQQISGLLSRIPICQATSPPKVSPSTSPPLVSSPRISQLHELPRPPANLAARMLKSSSFIGHSAPFVRSSEQAGNNKIPSTVSNFASPLPLPPLVLPRSFSIPSSGQRSLTSKRIEPTQVPRNDSPPLTSISLANIKPPAEVSPLVSQSGQIRGGS